jgi:hypothetical protein
MAQTAFCREKQLSHNAFYYWYRKLSEHSQAGLVEVAAAGGEPLKLPLAEVVVVEPEPGSPPGSRGDGQDKCDDAGCYEICLRGERRIRLGADFEESVVARLVRVLEGD